MHCDIQIPITVMTLHRDYVAHSLISLAAPQSRAITDCVCRTCLQKRPWLTEFIHSQSQGIPTQWANRWINMFIPTLAFIKLHELSPVILYSSALLHRINATPTNATPHNFINKSIHGPLSSIPSEEFELTASSLRAHIETHGGLILRTLS